MTFQAEKSTSQNFASIFPMAAESDCTVPTTLTLCEACIWMLACSMSSRTCDHASFQRLSVLLYQTAGEA